MNPLPLKRKKTLIVDDHPVFLDGMISILKNIEEIEILHSVSTAEDALEIIEHNEIEFVITDINLPNMSGTELTKKIKSSYPEIPVLVLSMFIGRELVKEIILAEAEGYLSKRINKTELFRAVDQIVHGGTYYANEITTVMMDLLTHKKKGRVHLKHELTNREREVLHLICQENSSKEIASKLFISITTVETHRRSMLQKTRAKSVIGLIKYAVENNLVIW